MVDFSLSSPLPSKVTRETGGSVTLLMAPIAFALTKSSTTGYAQPGNPNPASMDFANPTEITKRMLGTPNVEVGARIGQQGASFKCDLQDQTPFARQIKNKTDLVVSDTIATLLFTSALISTGTQLIGAFTLTGSSLPAVGDWLRIPQSSGASANNAYRYVQGVSNNGVNNIAVTLETDMDEIPLAGVTVSRIVQQQLYEASGSKLANYTSLFNVSGDDTSTMRVFSEKGYAFNGSTKVGDGKASQMYSLEINCLAKKVLIGTSYQPVHWDVDFFPPNR